MLHVNYFINPSHTQPHPRLIRSNNPSPPSMRPEAAAVIEEWDSLDAQITERIRAQAEAEERDAHFAEGVRRVRNAMILDDWEDFPTPREAAHGPQPPPPMTRFPPTRSRRTAAVPAEGEDEEEENEEGFLVVYHSSDDEEATADAVEEIDEYGLEEDRRLKVFITLMAVAALLAAEIDFA